MSREDLGALEDTLELLSDPKAVAEIAQATDETQKGQFVSAEELRAKYIKR
jgi:PHD/YefM family antitoxin component YafN of YafNO toxin-antitoxin module